MGIISKELGEQSYGFFILTMVRVIWREFCKVWIQADNSYGSVSPYVIVGQYIWVALQSHWVME